MGSTQRHRQGTAAAAPLRLCDFQLRELLLKLPAHLRSDQPSTLCPASPPLPPASEVSSFDDAAAAGRPVVLLQLYGAVEDGEALATAGDEAALQAVMAAADGPGGVLCVQPLKLSAEGAIQ